jgi:hypothetical protein
MTRSVVASLLAAGAWALPAWAAEPKPIPPPKLAQVGLVRVDITNRQISFDSEVCLREGVLEFLLCGWRTKTHESVLHTQAKASHMHAGLLMLGLTAGKPARWSGEDEAARFLTPAGAPLKIVFSWRNKDGQLQQAHAGTWLKGAPGKNIATIKEWIFVGSEILPNGRYWAELDGEVISVTNFPSAVIDVPFRSSNSNELRDLYSNTEAIPPLGTKVEVTIAALANAEKAPDARVMLDIDKLGRMRVDEQPVTPEGLQDWAAKYISQHERGMVVARAAGEALVNDVEAARLNLRLGGVREFQVQRMPLEGEPLPRTAEEARAALAKWAEKFATYKDLIEDPGEQALRACDQVELTLKNMEAAKVWLKDYATQLRQAAGKHKASTQPAGGGGAGGKDKE